MRFILYNRYIMYTNIHNLSYDSIFKEYEKNKEGVLLNTSFGKVHSIDTGKYTGRSPKDKWLVSTDKNVWWGEINQEMSDNVFTELYDKCMLYLNTLAKCYIYDGYACKNSKHKTRLRFYSKYVWQHHYVKNMFFDSKETPRKFKPDITIINACDVINPDWEKHNLHSEIFIALNLDKKLCIIGGTHYGGCMKKGIFTCLNYYLPLKNVLTMHCSVNIGKNMDSVVFFGLSGTGKTTLSADKNRRLVGDDEHGWDERGIFNIEHGCYAKTINLSYKTEPEIYNAIRPNALLENVYYDSSFNIDYSNNTKTENARVSYPIHHIDNFYDGISPHPKHIIFLTCDAFGVLPPISRLTTKQAMYHFVSGYTAKVAGTERGVLSPQATFSACFGAAFLPLHPCVYAKLLHEKIDKHGSRVWLVNTGWINGKYGKGSRIPIHQTRKCVDAIINNLLEDVEYHTDKSFGFKIPLTVPGVDSEILIPKWENMSEYNSEKRNLITLFKQNYKQFIQPNMPDYSCFGPCYSCL